MPASIPRYLAQTAQRLPDKVAIVSRERSITFGELQAQAQATALCLREMGLQPGDRVGICMEKTIDQVLAILGVLHANAVVVPILPRLKAPNIRHIIENSGMAAMVTDADRLGEVSDFAGITRLITGHGEVSNDWPNLPYLRRFTQPRNIFDRIGNDNAAIIYSSGSTGRPKGILISHRNLAEGADIVAEYLGTREDDRIGCMLSFNFDYGMNQIWQTIRQGCTLVLHELALPNDLFAMMAKERITALPVMPVFITKMFDRRLKVNTSAFDFSALRYVCSTGGRLSDDMISDLRGAFPQAQVYSMFGLTEAFRATYLPPDKLASHPQSVGRSIPDCQVMVLDENGDECPPHVVGELVQRGATVTKGYWNDPENTAKTFRTHPRFPGETLVFSGDRVYRDENDFIYFVARADDMIKTKGFRVSPTEVEIEVVRHPEVVEAVAFAVPNISVGEDVACAYTTVSGKPLPEAVFRQFLKGGLPSHMVPALLLHFDGFPILGNAGKLDRKAIKQAALERLAATPPAA
ncbi:AMP-binding protein [Aquincola sp. J276]|uniref:AMP-binding protein n=1 Tax=Aquincola sp. J276 TaxID=2898432 RepID=UPI002151AD17|nr:AMP-binding protein [Aquincola sp. J276]MCR5867181.1 AMP-binding protein [Aquincola sp. J276]